MSGEIIVGSLVVGFLAVTFYFNRPAGSIAGNTPVETKSEFHLVRHAAETDGRLVISDHDGVVRGEYGIVDNQLYQTPEQAESGALHARLIRDFYLVDPKLDLGTWGAYLPHNDPAVDTLQVGLRVSPFRLLYGSVAVDAVISQDTGGAGLSLYPPTKLFGPAWHHVGLGAWYVAPFDGSGPRWSYGLSFSIR